MRTIQEHIVLLQALAAGKKIQMRTDAGTWVDSGHSASNFALPDFTYRVKPPLRRTYAMVRGDGGICLHRSTAEKAQKEADTCNRIYPQYGPYTVVVFQEVDDGEAAE